MELMAGFEPATSSLPIIFYRFIACFILLYIVSEIRCSATVFRRSLIISCFNLSCFVLNTFIVVLNTLLNTSGLSHISDRLFC